MGAKGGVGRSVRASTPYVEEHKITQIADLDRRRRAIGGVFSPGGTRGPMREAAEAYGGIRVGEGEVFSGEQGGHSSQQFRPEDRDRWMGGPGRPFLTGRREETGGRFARPRFGACSPHGTMG